MTEAAKKILTAAMELSTEERADIVDVLLAADDPVGLPFDPAWLAEVDRRLEDYDTGRKPGIPWQEVRRRAAVTVPENG